MLPVAAHLLQRHMRRLIGCSNRPHRRWHAEAACSSPPSAALPRAGLAPSMLHVPSGGVTTPPLGLYPYSLQTKHLDVDLGWSSGVDANFRHAAAAAERAQSNCRREKCLSPCQRCSDHCAAGLAGAQGEVPQPSQAVWSGWQIQSSPASEAILRYLSSLSMPRNVFHRAMQACDDQCICQSSRLSILTIASALHYSHPCRSCNTQLVARGASTG
jgi:hypothetical protein